MLQPTLYAKVNDLQRRGGQEIAEEFANELGKVSGRCIDIGSGLGDVVAEFILPKLNPTATLLCSDVSERMVNFGKEAHKGNDRLSFVKLDIQTPNLPEDLIGRFDLVTSFYCLHWCHDQRQVFENIFNLLQPGGTAILLIVQSCSLWDCYNALAAIPRYQPYMTDRNRFIPIYYKAERPRDILKKLLIDVGYDIRHLSHREMTYIFDTQDAMKNFVVSVDAYVEGMPVDLREEYKEDLVKEFVKTDSVFQKHNTENDCSTVWIYHVFVVHLQKPSSE